MNRAIFGRGRRFAVVSGPDYFGVRLPSGELVDFLGNSKDHLLLKPDETKSELSRFPVSENTLPEHVTLKGCRIALDRLLKHLSQLKNETHTPSLRRKGRA
jgi:hypothetical protein